MCQQVQVREPEKQKDKKSFWMFLFGSIAGVLLFLVPVPQEGGGYNLIIGIVAEGILAYIKPAIPVFLAVLLGGSLILAIAHKIWHFQWIEKREVLREPFTCTPLKLALRAVGTILFFMAAFQLGPEWIWSADTGGTMLSLLVTLSIWHFISFYFFSLLMDFGAMNFIGTIIKNIMRPLFTLPGCSAITCIAAWIGNGPLGVIVTNLQYKEGFYTKRESAVIATCFSIVSITFSVIVARTLNILSVFVPYYLTICLCTLICAFVMPRIYPLRKKPDEYCPGVGRTIDEGGKEKHLFKKAVQNGTEKAATVSLKHIVHRGNNTAVDFFISLYPVMMAYGTILLIVSTYTPIVQIIATPMQYILSALRVPEAGQAAPALLIGFVDMFLPAVLGSGIQTEMTRFIIGCVSISQLIYMTETGVIILKNRDTFQVSFLDLVIMFLIRTAISLPIAVGVAHLIY